MDHLQHVAIVVSNIDEAVKWYQSMFDLKISYLDESWALLRFANISMALVLPDQHPPHIGIERNNPASFGQLNHHRDGTSSTYIKDPWGNSIEIMSASSGPY